MASPRAGVSAGRAPPGPGGGRDAPDGGRDTPGGGRDTPGGGRDATSSAAGRPAWLRRPTAAAANRLNHAISRLRVAEMKKAVQELLQEQ